MNAKEVLIVFKTHLDIGFTDYSETIISKYLNEYIPNAIRTGYELKDTATPFIWTVGSWLIWEALKQDKDGSVDQAIKDGVINWHALPFTTHTELMNEALFEHGLSISQKLDARYGRKTVGAKMTDVPGHTIGMVPLLCKKGIRFLHIGVNPATPVPPVPPIFRWKRNESEITVMYQGDYGNVAEFDDFIVYFAHTNDNCGPQSADEIIRIYDSIQARFPGCTLKAATLNDIAQKVESLKDLPVIRQEIGDTWIHGAATDPEKLSRFRKVLRYLAEHKTEQDLSDSLLLVPEHTWGMDVKTFFPDYTHYSHRDMETLVKERSVIERSWSEQREYVCRAERLLGLTPDYPVEKPDISQYTETAIPADFDMEISWQLFDNGDYQRYSRDYIRSHVDWAIRDFTKIGLPDDKGGIYRAEITHAYVRGSETLFKLEFPKKIAENYGLPCFYLARSGKDITVKWFGKKVSRLPQAFWLKMKGFDENWEFHKLGQWIKPEDVIGSPLLSAVDKGVRNGEAVIEPLDCALVAPYGRRLLQYGCTNLSQDLYFCLYNNVWNTNFPMWYSDDALFRFHIESR